MKKHDPVIYQVGFSQKDLGELETTVKEEDTKYIFQYPTVYIVNNKKTDKYQVYVGETTNIKKRTDQHIVVDPKNRADWNELVQAETSKMYVIGHEHFNKSLTLDIENRLMHYLSGVESVEKINNRRTNQQNQYYTSKEFENIFHRVWKKLTQLNKDLFPIESVIKDSALFKASPFHRLNQEQSEAKDLIMEKVQEAIQKNEDGQLILVVGAAGSGKTVLMSSLFYELNQLSKSTTENPLQKTSQYLLVNHDQQVLVYKQLALKLGIIDKEHPNAVDKPTPFINRRSEKEKVDVIIVDEAHLLWTQGKQSYRGKNQLADLQERARVVVAVFDPQQILSTEQYLEENEIQEKMADVNAQGNLIALNVQMRIEANQKTIEWIRNFIDQGEIKQIPADKSYALKIFDDVDQMYQQIKKKAEQKDNGISRLLATFDWPYKDKGKETYKVTVGNWELPWNLQSSKKERSINKNFAWAEQTQTIKEVGSTFTIQGFDLNYAGVIIGPSVKLRDGKIIFDRTASKNHKATQKRTLKNGNKIYTHEQLLKNELNVLLTRGVHGLYIYAVDEELRNALLGASKNRKDQSK